MIDLHCHILPGIDDGPAGADEALDMCRLAAADGITCIVATPHYKPGTYEWTGEAVAEAAASLTAAARDAGLDLSILPGAEVWVSPEMAGQLNSSPFLTLNAGPYFLAEFSPASVPAGWDRFLMSFVQEGLIPVIAHPERNHWFVRNPESLIRPVQAGVKIQITAMSLTGEFGPVARDAAVDLLRRNMVHLIASDAHSAGYRTPQLSDAVRVAESIVGAKKAHDLVTTNPRTIVSGRPLPLWQPQPLTPAADPPGRTWLQRIKDLCFA